MLASAVPQGKSATCMYVYIYMYIHTHIYFSQSIQLLSCVWLFATPWTAALQASVSIANFQSLLKFMSIKLVMPSNYLILCRPLLLLPSIFPSIRGFSNESALCIRWPKYWSFSFSIIPSNEHPGLISFRMDWLDLLAVQGTLKSLLQHHSSKASILWHRYISIPPSWTSLLPPHYTHLGYHRAPSWASCALQWVPTSHLFHTW